MAQIRIMKNSIQKFIDLLKRSIIGDSLLWANEITANMLTQVTMSLMCLILVITEIFTRVGIFGLNQFLVDLVCLPNIVLLLAGIILLNHYIGAKPWLKSMALTMICITVGSSGAVLGFRTILAYSIPAILSTRYMSKKVTQNVCLLSVLMIILSSVAYCFIGASVDFNVIELPANTILTVTGPLDSALDVSNIMKIPYILAMFKYSILTNCLLYFVIAMICIEVSRLGYTMVEEQRKLASEHATINTELNVAKQIQEHALPIVHDLQEDDSFELAVLMDPAKEIGGDFYDFLMIDESHLALVIADVSGKGVPAAMYMMVSKLLIDNSMQTGKSPADILTEVNHQICEKNLDDMFVTVWLAVINLATGDVVSANAGHEYPLLRRKDGKFEVFKDKHGLVLGGMDGIRYKEQEFKIYPGDSLFVYTDGVTEANNIDGGFYGLDRTCDQLNKTYNGNMKDLVQKLKEDITDFTGEGPQFDDITMMGFHFNHYKMEDGKIFKPGQESIPVVEAYLESQMEEAELSMKQVSRLNVAIDEIYSNIVYYSHSTWVKASLAADDSRIRVTFVDNGIPYNPLERDDPDTDLDLDERQVGGLGIFLTRKLMDEVIYRYENGNNINILVMNR